jgi:hypothetical protein
MHDNAELADLQARRHDTLAAERSLADVLAALQRDFLDD